MVTINPAFSGWEGGQLKALRILRPARDPLREQPEYQKCNSAGLIKSEIRRLQRDPLKAMEKVITYSIKVILRDDAMVPKKGCFFPPSFLRSVMSLATLPCEALCLSSTFSLFIYLYTPTPLLYLLLFPQVPSSYEPGPPQGFFQLKGNLFLGSSSWFLKSP